MRLRRPAASLLALSLMAAPALADPAAIVEDVVAGTPGVEFMQFLDAGETITGGTVTVGERQSEIAGGLVVREKVNCDTDQLVLTSRQSNESGVVTFRAGPAAGDPVVTVYGTRPVFVFETVPAELVIERRDRRVADIVLAPAGPHLDLSDTSTTLAPKGIYRVRAGGKTVTIRVDSSARSRHVPLVSRLVRM